MHNQELYLKNSGLLFAHKFERVVHGGRGNYVEFTYEQILPKLYYKFEEDNTEFDINNFDKYTGYYYHWLYPLFDKETKVYFQLKTVKYADYKLYHFYVSPDLFINFKDPQSLF